MKSFSRIVCIILDGVGVGEAPDAERYGDVGSNSLSNTARAVGALRLPVLGRMGLGNVAIVDGVPAESQPTAWFGKMTPVSPGKDSVTGHWELMGCHLGTPFDVFLQGFPGDVVARFERAIGRTVIGNVAASGTGIIQELGAEHLRTGSPILYTSQDSVFQLACHESVVPVEELYRWCETAREQLGPRVARVIARPFAGRRGGFYRTSGRRDFALPPVRETVLDALTARGHGVLAIGKIADLFSRRGVRSSIGTKDNREGMARTLSALRERKWSLVFTNLVDFDTMWGHRNDPRAYALGLEEFDSFLKTFLPELREDELLIITSDHGNDPTTASTDHSRENVPLLVYHVSSVDAGDLGVRETFSDVGKTIADNFQLDEGFPGTSFLGDVAA